MRPRLILAGAALLAFGASLGGSFHFDDYAIFADPAIRQARGWLDVWRFSRTRPLTYLTFWMNYQAGGQDPLGYHLFSLALHVGAVLLAFECLRRILPERVALLGAAIFAVHPVQAEAVNYISARSIVLATLLCFAAWRSRLEGRDWMAAGWFALALLAKEECAAFPLMLLMFDRKRLAPLGAMLGMAAAAGAHVVYATAMTPGARAGFQAGITPGRYLLAQGPAILRYLRMVIVPYGFSVDPDVPVPQLWWGVAAWLVVLSIAAVAWRYGGAGRWIAGGLILLIPSSSIFPAADLATDRRMYLPMIAFAAAAALLLARIDVRAVEIAVAAALAIVSVTRTLVWHSEQSLWTEAVGRAPDKVRPKIQLARAVPAAKALDLLSQARNLAPHDPAIAAEIGRTLLREGQLDGALEEFGRALTLEPNNAANLNNRGVALAELGQTEAARADFERALEIDPQFAEARENLARITGPGRPPER